MSEQTRREADYARGKADWNSGKMELPAEPDNQDYMDGWLDACDEEGGSPVA